MIAARNNNITVVKYIIHIYFCLLGNEAIHDASAQPSEFENYVTEQIQVSFLFSCCDEFHFMYIYGPIHVDIIS